MVQAKKSPGWRGVEDGMAEAGKKVEVQISVCRRRDGLYTVAMNRPGSSAKLTGCTWEDAQKMIAEVGPKINVDEAMRRIQRHIRSVTDLVLSQGAAYDGLGMPIRSSDVTMEDAARSVHANSCAGVGPAQECSCQKAISATKFL